MSDYNTGNPVPSIDPRDLDDNATIFDRLLNEVAASVLDRTNVPRKTWWQMEQDSGALLSPNITALAALVGAANKGFWFTGPGAMSTFDFTAQGRTFLAAVDQAAQRLALGLPTGVYGQANVLGVVSQSAGVPTGALIESGGSLTGTGRYEKYADGSMTISKTLVTSAGSTIAAGAIFQSVTNAAGAFPVNFVGSVPSVVASGTDGTGGGWAATDVFPTLSSWGSYSTRNHVSAPGAGVINLVARGKWI